MISYKDSDVDTKLGTSFLVDRYKQTNDEPDLRSRLASLPCEVQKNGDYEWVLINQFDEVLRTRDEIYIILEECRARGYEWLYVTNGLKRIRVGKRLEPDDDEEEVHINDIEVYDSDDYMSMLEALAPELYNKDIMSKWRHDERVSLRMHFEQAFGCWLYIDDEDHRNRINLSMNDRIIIKDIAYQHQIDHLAQKLESLRDDNAEPK